MKYWPNPERKPPPKSLYKELKSDKNGKIFSQLSNLSKTELGWFVVRMLSLWECRVNEERHERFKLRYDIETSTRQELEEFKKRAAAVEEKRSVAARESEASLHRCLKAVETDLSVARQEIKDLLVKDGNLQFKLKVSENALLAAQKELEKDRVFGEPLDRKSLTSAVVVGQLRAVREQIVSVVAQGGYSLTVPGELICLEATKELEKEGFVCSEGSYHKPSTLSAGVLNPRPGVVIQWGSSPFEGATKPLRQLGS